MGNDVVVYYRVKNWDHYQSYPNRRMSWFKLYGVDLCNDDAFYALTETQRLQLMSCWTIASVNENRIPDRGRFPERYNLSAAPLELSALEKAGFLEIVEEKTAIPGVLPLDDQVVNNLNGSGLPRLEEIRLDKKREEDVLKSVYDHWRKARSKTDARYNRISPNRRRKIASRLHEFSADELIRAIDAVALDPWDERPRHDDLTTIFRSEEQVQKFLALYDDPSVLSQEERLRRHFANLEEKY